jgi:hypothetical protein
MKRIPTWVLCMIIVFIISFILIYQREDIMKMEHWLELIGLEFVIQLLYNRLTEKTNGNITRNAQ